MLAVRALRSQGGGRVCTHKSAFCKRGSVNVRFAPEATEVRRCRELTRCANGVLAHRSKQAFFIRSPRRRGRASDIRGTKHYGMSGRHHSGLMLAARITLPHFSTSSAMSLPKSAGEPGGSVPPGPAILVFMWGCQGVRL